MQIKIVKVGLLATNCYIISNGRKCIIIDPGDNAPLIKSNIGSEVVGIIITHRHFDHIGALNELVKEYNVNVYDKSNLSEGINNIDCFNFEVIYTPGHTEDSICILFDKIMFSGDFLFKNTIGRCDLGGNFDDMLLSIDKIKKYSRDIVVYPGHGDSTTLGIEFKGNQFFQK